METITQHSALEAPMFDDSLYPSQQPLGDALELGESDFNKMFPDLPSFAEGQDCKDVLARLRILGKKGGLMDAKDPLVTVTNPLEANDIKNPDNPNPDMTVGFTFLGQFLDHDITFDPLALGLSCGNKITGSRNLRSPFFDLDSVYGRGPDEDRLLYDRSPELNFLGCREVSYRLRSRTRPAPDQPTARHHRRPPQRRERHHLSTALVLPQVPQ